MEYPKPIDYRSRYPHNTDSRSTTSAVIKASSSTEPSPAGDNVHTCPTLTPPGERLCNTVDTRVGWRHPANVHAVQLLSAPASPRLKQHYPPSNNTVYLYIIQHTLHSVDVCMYIICVYINVYITKPVAATEPAVPQGFTVSGLRLGLPVYNFLPVFRETQSIVIA